MQSKINRSITEVAMRKEPRFWMFTPAESRLLVAMLAILLTAAVALITKQRLP